MGTFDDANRTPRPCIVDLRGIAKPAAHAVTLRGTSKAGSESATNASDVLSDTPMTQSAKDSGGDAFPGVIDSTSDVGPDSNDDPDSTGDDAFLLHLGNTFDDDDDEAHALSINAISGDFGELGVDLSPWAPLLAMLDSTEPEEAPGDRPFTPGEGVNEAHALELRAESMLQYSERGAERTGELDRTEVGVSDDNRDVVAGRDQVEIDGMLEEHTGHGLVHVADDVEVNVEGSLRMHAHLEDNIIMGGVMTDEWKGGTFITAAMSDDMAAGLGLRCTAPLDVWVHGLVGMEERPGTRAADGVLFELAGTLYEREYGPSAHVAVVARHSGTVVTTMKTGFRPLMKTAIGVRNLIPGGGGGGGGASASPPAAPPASGGGGEAAGAVTLTAVESGGALGRGVAGSDDTDEIVTVVRTVETASDTAEVENLQHPASTADNLDDLARVEAEGTGYQQVAEIYEQPIPLAPEQTAAEPSPGAGSTAAGSGGKQPPPLDHTAPGAEGYDFGSAYSSLHDRNQFYRQELNLRGNLYLREYLGEIDKKAIALFEALGGSADDIAIDNYGLRTSNVYAAVETMANEAEMAGDVERLADIRAAMDQLEALVQSTLADVAAHTDDFSGVAIGSQRGPINPNIDVDKLRSWLEEQKLAAQQAMMDPQTPFENFQRLSWTQDYYDQTLKALDAGINPLAESSDQVAFIQAGKVEPYKAQFTDEIAAAEAAGDWVLIPPRAPDQDQLDLFRELHDGLMGTLSDPEFFRSAEEMGGDTFTAAVHSPMDPGPRLAPGPTRCARLPTAWTSPTSTPFPAPMFHRRPRRSISPGPGPKDTTSGKPTTRSRIGTCSTGTNSTFAGNFFMREYLRNIDKKAIKLFQGLDGPADAIDGDNFGYRTSSIYRTVEQMAEDAEAANDLNRAADLRAGMAEIEEIVNGTLAEVAMRTDEFSGAAPWSPRAPIDPNIDTGKLRRWLQDQADQAQERLLAARTDEAQQLAGWEWGYYVQLVRSLDEGVNPLAVSNEQIAVMSINTGKPIPTQVADEVAATAGEGHELVSPRPQAGDEAYLYASLQELLIATLSDPEFHRSAEEMGAGAFTFPVRARIDEGLDFLGPDSLRPLGAGDIPPPLPVADFADSAGYIDEVRDRNFSRSALAASEETLERRAAGFAEGDASVRSRAPVSDSGAPEPSLASRRVPPDSAQAPIIDERTGRWVVEPPAEPGGSPAPSDDATSRTTDVSWESGLQVSDDSEFDAGDADPWDFFRAASEPDDVDLEGVDDVQHAPAGGRRRPPRLDDRALRRHAGRGCEPDRHALRAGRFHHDLRRRQRDRTRSFGHRFEHHPGHARSSVHRHSPERTGHRRHAGRRLGVRCGRGSRRHSLGPLQRTRVLRRTLARGDAPFRRFEGARTIARRCGDSDRGPPSRRTRSGRIQEEIHPQARRRHARSRPLLRGRGRGDYRSAHRVREEHRGQIQPERGHRVEKRPQPQGGGGCGQRPLVRVRCGEAHLVNLLQRRPAPGSVPRRARDHAVLEHGGEDCRRVPRGRSPKHARPLPGRALRSQAPGLEAGTRDRIRPTLAGMERISVLAPRTGPEHAVEGRVPEPRADRGARVGPRGLSRRGRLALLVPAPGHGGHDLGSERPVPARPVVHGRRARQAARPAHRDARLCRHGGLSASSRGPRRYPFLGQNHCSRSPGSVQQRQSFSTGASSTRSRVRMCSGSAVNSISVVTVPSSRNGVVGRLRPA